MVIPIEDVCCIVVFGTLVGVSVFSVMWYKCQRVECAFTSLVRTACGMLVMCAVLYDRVSLFCSV